jgi:hypothetical protein
MNRRLHTRPALPPSQQDQAAAGSAQQTEEAGKMQERLNRQEKLLAKCKETIA